MRAVGASNFLAFKLIIKNTFWGNFGCLALLILFLQIFWWSDLTRKVLLSGQILVKLPKNTKCYNFVKNEYFLMKFSQNVHFKKVNVIQLVFQNFSFFPDFSRFPDFGQNFWFFVLFVPSFSIGTHQLKFFLYLVTIFIPIAFI